MHTHQQASQILSEGKVPALLGGDHSTPFGAILACAEFVEKGPLQAREGLGILHLDAHRDLRQAFEGFQWSHASIMFNVLERIPQITAWCSAASATTARGRWSMRNRWAATPVRAW